MTKKADALGIVNDPGNYKKVDIDINDEMSSEKNKALSRRNFLKIGGAAAALHALGGLVK